MKITTFEQLQKTRQEFGAKVFGKIAQKLLAVAFRKSGFQHVVERGVQGVDIDAANLDGTKYALEVKTTEGQDVLISKDNIDALLDRKKDGYTPVLAVLRMQMFEDWVLSAVPLNHLRPGSIPTSRLRSYRLRELEASICPMFEHVVDEHIGGVLSRGERYLIEVLSGPA